jgi:hypothetical protein
MDYDLIIIKFKINLFSLWYSWKIAELALSNNYSLTIYIFRLFIPYFFCICVLLRLHSVVLFSYMRCSNVFVCDRFWLFLRLLCRQCGIFSFSISLFHPNMPTLYKFIYGTIESVVLSLIVGAFNHTKSHNWIENGHLLKMTASKSNLTKTYIQDVKT